MSNPEMTLACGEWQVRIEPATAALELTHAAADVKIAGQLNLEIDAGNGVFEPWTITGAKDGVSDRFALRDARGDVQGYLRLVDDRGGLNLLVVHRAAQAYKGRITFVGTAVLSEDAFACRSSAPAKMRVVQMASGPVDSTLNDALFAPASDLLVRFGGASVRIESSTDGSPRCFGVVVVARPEAPDVAALRFWVVQDHFRDRYAPWYRVIDRDRCPSVPTGWMSWNVYFDQAGEEENLAEARAGKELLQPFGLEFWSIESWQRNSDTLPVSDFHNLTLAPHAGQFSHGMKWLAERIRELGFRPGIWTVPFGTGDPGFYETHSDWFLHDEHGKPFKNWCGRFVLDPSQERVREHMRDTHRIMARDWGYEFFKIDGMSGRSASYSAHFYERDEVRAAFRSPCDNPFERCVQALRDGIGPDRVFLACQGHYTGPETAFADASRIGGDIVSPNQPSRWGNILSQARSTLNQLFVHNILWYNDPDTLLVGAYRTLAEARATATVVALPGQVMFAGDKLRELAPERVRLLQQVLPVCDVHPLDLYPIFEMTPIWTLKVRRSFAAWDVVSVFNWSDQSEAVRLEFSELGLSGQKSFLVYDFWEKEFLGEFTDGVDLDVPEHANRLLALRPALGRPQFLSTDRHVTQGAVSLQAIEWDEAAHRLRGRSKVVGGHPSELVFHVPEGWTFDSLEAGVPVEASVDVDDPRLVRIVLKASTGGAADWCLEFNACPASE